MYYANKVRNLLNTTLKTVVSKEYALEEIQ